MVSKGWNSYPTELFKGRGSRGVEDASRSSPFWRGWKRLLLLHVPFFAQRAVLRLRLDNSIAFLSISCGC